ncbi:MAG: 23S rRNA (guanosine(2251)-2'-O)-methyltransferase RlmB [Flavobacteriales bacterium]
MNSRNYKPRPAAPARNNMIIGFRAIEEAIASGKEFDKILIQKGLKGDLYTHVRKLLSDNQIPSQQVPQEKLDQLTRSNHQGIIGFTSPISFGSVEEIIAQTYEKGITPKLLYLDGVTDVRNFGAICRTAECQGFQAVIVPEKGSAQINEDAVKTSAGALFHIPVCRVKSAGAIINILQSSGIRLVGCTEKTDTLIQDVDMTGPICIIMGAEDTGISDEFIRKADALGKIPMFGQTSSLNVSVAAGIIMFELNRQRL